MSHETSLPNERKLGIRVVQVYFQRLDTELGRIFADLCDLAAATVVPYPLKVVVTT